MEVFILDLCGLFSGIGSPQMMLLCCCAVRVSVDVLYAIHDCALGKSPVTSYSGVKRGSPQSEHACACASGIGIGLFFFGVAEPIQHYEPCYGPPFSGPDGECNGNRYSFVRAPPLLPRTAVISELSYF